MLEILPIPAFEDNYIWLINDGKHAVIVDPGDATPAIKMLEQSQLVLDAILITHHHHDHIDGVHELLSKYNVPVFAPAKEVFDFPYTPVAEGDSVTLKHLDLKLDVIEIPGHTLGHIAYYSHPYLFCGDTLFSCGCGRLFEGTPQQLHRSLQRLAKLPEETMVFCTHEYTARNIDFALNVEPSNNALRLRQLQVKALRNTNKPSLPTTIKLELKTNPFLRCHIPAIQKAVGIDQPESILTVFTQLREMRNHY